MAEDGCREADRAGEGTGVHVVFFDVGGTLLRPWPSVGAVYAEAARAVGGGEAAGEVEPAWLEARFGAAWRRSVERSRARGYLCGDGVLREEWLRIVSETFGDRAPRGGIEPLFRELYERFSSPSAWRVADGVAGEAGVLARLSARGLGLGVLSNWDRRLSATLRGFGLERWFDPIVVSHEVGVEKPHRRIFEVALERCAARGPEEVLLIGDSLEADILPARRLGWRTLWLRGAHRSRRSAGTSGSRTSRETGPSARCFREVGDREWEELLGGRDPGAARRSLPRPVR